MPLHEAAGRLSRAEAEDFLIRQAEYLDSRDFRGWERLFLPGGHYWIPLKPDDTDPETQLSVMYDDGALMTARIARLEDPHAGSQQPPTRSSHLIGNIRVEEGQGSEIRLRSRFHVTQFRRDVAMQFAGAYTHFLRREDGALRIWLQRVDLVSADGVYDYNLQIYL